MKSLRNLMIAWLGAVLMTACGPSHILLEMERSVPAEKDIDIRNNAVGILLNENGIAVDSVAFVAFADGFAKTIEGKMDLAEGSLPVFVGNTGNTVGDMSYSFSDIDILFIINDVRGNSINVAESYFMEDGIIYLVEADAVLNFDAYNLNTGEKVDDLHGEHNVQWYEHVDYSVSPDIFLENLPYTKGDIYNFFGGQAAEKYFDSWKKVDRTLLVYENKEGWSDAYFAAMGFRWDEAIAFWMNRTEYGSLEETACAAYNLAVAFEVAGDYDLALKWLDASDSISKQSCSGRQRTIIERAKRGLDK